jgi:hypothetical protein
VGLPGLPLLGESVEGLVVLGLLLAPGIIADMWGDSI